MEDDPDEGVPALATESDEETLMAPKRDGPATGVPRASESLRFRTEVMALDCSPILVVKEAISLAEGGVHEGLSKSSIST